MGFIPVWEMREGEDRRGERKGQVGRWRWSSLFIRDESQACEGSARGKNLGAFKGSYQHPAANETFEAQTKEVTCTSGTQFA